MHVCYHLCMEYTVIRISKETHALLVTLAKAQIRTIKGEVEYLIEQKYRDLSLDASPVGVEATK